MWVSRGSEGLCCFALGFLCGRWDCWEAAAPQPLADTSPPALPIFGIVESSFTGSLLLDGTVIGALLAFVVVLSCTVVFRAYRRLQRFIRTLETAVVLVTSSGPAERVRGYA